MAKKEVYKLPVFKTAARAFNFIKVDRNNPNDKESINAQAKNLFSNGWSLMVYPQGTRFLKMILENSKVNIEKIGGTVIILDEKKVSPNQEKKTEV